MLALSGYGTASALMAFALGAAPAHAAIRWNLPLNAPIRYTQGFLGTEFPYSPDGLHRALDMVKTGDRNAELFAIAAGNVLHNKYNSYLGNYIVIAHADSYFSLYAHLQNRALPSEGSRVQAAQRIGNVGGTPNFDPHLHLEMFKGRYYRGDYQGANPPGGTRIAPEPILRGAPHPNQVSNQPDPEPEPDPLELNDMYVIQSPSRGAALVGAGFFRQLNNAEETENAKSLVGADNVRSGNDRQFDLWRSMTSTGEAVVPPAGPFIMKSPNRVTALVDHGFFRELRSQEEIDQANMFTPRRYNINDRQYDLAQSIAVAN